MSKHRLEDKGLEARKVDTTLYDRGLSDEPTLLPVETRDKELQAVIDANRQRRANMMYSARSLFTAGAFLMGRGEQFDLTITLPQEVT